MTLEHIDIVELEALEARLDAVKDVLAAQAVLVDALGRVRVGCVAVDWEVDLGGELRTGTGRDKVCVVWCGG